MPIRAIGHSSSRISCCIRAGLSGSLGCCGDERRQEFMIRVHKLTAGNEGCRDEDFGALHGGKWEKICFFLQKVSLLPRGESSIISQEVLT